jgi:hypothetical protein
MKPGGSYHSLPGVETLSWRPCLSRSYEGDGPHAWFIGSSLEVTLLCPACRPTPWHPGRPVWFGEPDAAALIEWYEERAAIVEFDGGVSRGAAEVQAYRALVARFEVERAPVQMELVA